VAAADHDSSEVDMASSASPTAPPARSLRRPLTRRDLALLIAVAAGRCHLTSGATPSLLIDRRPACDQLAAYQLLINGLVAPSAAAESGEGPVPAELTPAGAAAAGCPAKAR